MVRGAFRIRNDVQTNELPLNPPPLLLIDFGSKSQSISASATSSESRADLRTRSLLRSRSTEFALIHLL
jgi:hypothetical protein